MKKVAPILLLVALALIGYGLYLTYFQKPSSQPAQAQPIPLPAGFSVTNTAAQYPSTLSLLGSYEIFIPGDNQFHDTKIEIRPNNQLQIGFTRGTEGNVTLQVGKFEGSFAKSQAADMWYEYDFRDHPPEDKFNHLMTKPNPLKVKSQGNISIRVEVRQL